MRCSWGRFAQLFGHQISTTSRIGGTPLEHDTPSPIQKADATGKSARACEELSLASDLPGTRRENIESWATMSLATERSVGKDQRRSWCHQRADVLQKERVYRDAACEVFQVWRFFADTRGSDPVSPATGINRR
jgi:hypothetical protein